MSKPRYYWWGHIRRMLYRYGTYIREEIDIESAKGRERREMQAVQKAMEDIKARKNGVEIAKLARLVYIEKKCTLSGAALECHISYETAVNWNKIAIISVAKFAGYSTKRLHNRAKHF